MSAIVFCSVMALPILATATEAVKSVSESVAVVSTTGLVGDLLEVAVEIAVVIGVFAVSTVVFSQVKGSKYGRTTAATKKTPLFTAPKATSPLKAAPAAFTSSGKVAELQEKLLNKAQGSLSLPGLNAVFARLAEEGLEDDVTLDAVLEACAAKSAWSVAACALSLEGEFDEELRTESYNGVMQGFANSGELTPCVNLCKDMRAKGLEPSATTYGILLSACLNAQDFLRAQSLVLDISKAGLELDAAQCHTCYRGLFSAGDNAEAEELIAAVPSAFDSATLARIKYTTTSLRPRTIAKPVTPPSPSSGGAWRSETPTTTAATENWRDRSASTAEVQQPSRGASHAARLHQYIEVNKIDSNCAQLLQKLMPAQAEWVMDQEFVIGVDSSRGSASAKAVAAAVRTKSKPAEFWANYPTKEDLSRRLAAYVQVNGLDRRCASTIEHLSEENLKLLMNQEFVVSVDPSRGTASSKVIWQVLKMRGQQQ